MGTRCMITDESRLSGREAKIALSATAETFGDAGHNICGCRLLCRGRSDVPQTKCVPHFVSLGILDLIVQALPIEKDVRPVRIAFAVGSNIAVLLLFRIAIEDIDVYRFPVTNAWIGTRVECTCN